MFYFVELPYTHYDEVIPGYMDNNDESICFVETNPQTNK